MNKKLEVEILKVIDAGHFQAKPVAKPGSEYESFMGQINDFFQCGKGIHSQAIIPHKGKMYAVKRTLDKCWYRARIQNIMTTMCGPQASVFLVDVGETTLVPYSMIRELPEEYENIPYQTMKCHLTGVKAYSMVTSYFDLTTSKQVCDHWSEAANNFVLSCIRGCKCSVQIQQEDAQGSYHVLLYAESSQKEMCVNDELIKEEYAVVSNGSSILDESPSKAERRRVLQENFQQKQQEIVNAFKQDINLGQAEEVSSTDDEAHTSRGIRFPHTDHRSSLAILRQEVEVLRGSSSSNRQPAVLPQGGPPAEINDREPQWPANQDDFLRRLGNSTGVRGAELFDSEVIHPTSSSSPTLHSYADSGQGLAAARAQPYVDGAITASASSTFPGGAVPGGADSRMHQSYTPSVNYDQGLVAGRAQPYVDGIRTASASSTFPGGAIPGGAEHGMHQSSTPSVNYDQGFVPGRAHPYLSSTFPRSPTRQEGGVAGGMSQSYVKNEHGPVSGWPQPSVDGARTSSLSTASSSMFPSRTWQDGGGAAHGQRQSPTASVPQQTRTEASSFAQLQEVVNSVQGSESIIGQEPMARRPFLDTSQRNTFPSGQEGRVSQEGWVSQEGRVSQEGQVSQEGRVSQGIYYPHRAELQARKPLSPGERPPEPQRQFSLSSDEEAGRVRFTSARLPATARSDPRDSSTRNAMQNPKPILKKDKTPPRQHSGSSGGAGGYGSDPTFRTYDDQMPSDIRMPSEFRRTLNNPSPSPEPLSLLPSEMVTGRPQPKTSRMTYQDGVVIHGEGAPAALTNIKDNNSPFYEYGPRLGIEVPTPIQRHFWPALLRGRDVAGVASPGSGRKVAYLLPIVEQVLESSVYRELPLTNGPLVLILCADHDSALQVYEMCRQMTRPRRRTRVEVIFSSGAEEERVVPLINGCEILVATLPCFVRMLKHSYTTLDRLCHVVFDDADVLVEDFTAEVKEIMRLYGRLLKSQPARLAPRQAIVMATQWTVGVASLVRAYLGNPLIIIADMVEASVFAGVKQPVTVCSSEQQLKELLGFVENMKSNHEIVVFTFTTEEANKLGEFLKSYNHHVLVAHEFLQPHELTDIRRQWNTPHNEDSVPILVMTDGVMSSNALAIHNASLVIHYDFPAKSKYAKRLRSIAHTYTTVKEHDCMSLIFLTEKSKYEAMTAYKLLTRSKANEVSQEQIPNQLNFPVSPDLENLATLAQKAKEEMKVHVDLCYCLMAYGACRYFEEKRRCRKRHVIIKDVDFPYSVPTSGTVKVLVLHVMRASNLWVRILEHRDPGGNLVPSTAYDSSQFLKLTMDMGLWYSNEANKVKVEIPRMADLCAVEQDGTYHRVKVCDITRKAQQSGLPLEVLVQFVDYGIYDYVKVVNLLLLPQEYRDLPFQAVQVFVCRVKPRDNDPDWTNKANYIVTKMVERKELEGKVMFSLNNTLWLDPLLERRVLKSINVTTNINNIRLELLKQGLATDNKQHLKRLRRLCEDVIDLSIYDDKTTAEHPSDPSSSLETVVLEEEDFVEVFVAALENPSLFFVQLNKTKDSLAELEEQINERVASVEGGDEDEDIAIGSLCLARFSADDKWYRARVLGMRDEVEYDVFYVDHGDREWVSRDRIKPAWPEALCLPLQAVECSLSNVSPLENDWSDVNSDAFYAMTDERLLFAKVKSKVGSLVSGYHRFVIELVDTSTLHDIDISQEMVALEHAQTSPEGVQRWFPEAIRPGQEQHTYDYEKVTEMCLEILKSRDHSQKLYIAKSLQTIVMNSTNAKDAIRESGGLNCICRLLSLTRAPAIQEHLLVSLDCLTFQNESNCEEARRNGALKTLCYLLEKSLNVTVQERVAWTLKNVSATERNKDTVRELGGIKVLCSVLETAEEEKLQENIAWALEVLAFDNDRNCKAVSTCGGIKSLCQLLASSTNKSVIERATRALAALAPDSGNRNAIRQHGGLEVICRKVQDGHTDEEYLRIAIGALKSLVNNNNHNRDVMRDLGMILTLQSLLLSPQKTSTITRRLCKDLLERLIGWAVAGMSLTTSPIKSPMPPSPVRMASTPNISTADSSSGATSSPVNGSLTNGSSNVQHDDADDMPPLEGDDTDDITQRPGLLAPLPDSQQHPGIRRKAKPKQRILAKPVEKSDDSGVEDESEGNSCVHPFTVWSQEKHIVRVAVRLRGAKKKRVRAQFLEKSLHFRTKMQGSNYQLDLDLFDDVIPEECEVQVKGAEILLLLKKSKGAEWPRLLKTREKLAYVSIDFDRWDVWSSSEEDNMPMRDRPKCFTKRISTPSSAKPTRKVILPEMDTGSSASSETEEEEFDVEHNEFISFD